MHRLLKRKVIVMGIIGILVVVGAVVAQMLAIHDQDVTIYSLMPDGQVQAIGLRHRTYLLDYGADRNLVLFSTTFSTGITTYGRKEDVYRNDRIDNHQERRPVVEEP